MSLITRKPTKRVLIVDDIADNLFLAQFILEDQGYEVNTANSGKAAITQVETEKIKPDLIILDLMMPEMDGYEVIEYLRNHQKAPYIPVLLMTADTSVSCEDALHAGASGIIYKPWDLEQFLKKVEMFNV